MATSPGGSKYTNDKTPKPYEGYHHKAIAEERRSDAILFLDGQPNWMDDPEEMDCNFPDLKRR